MKQLTALLTLAAIAATALAGEVLVKGSDTMLNLTQRLAEGFGGVRPDGRGRSTRPRIPPAGRDRRGA